MHSFSEQLTELCLDKNVKSNELAQAIGVSISTVNDWKRGKFNVFLSNALRLADYFECSLEYLMGRSETILDYMPKQCPEFYSHFLAVAKERGYTTYRLRKDSPIKGAHLNKWKQGADPLLPTLQVAADFLGVTIDYLVGREK